MSDKEATSEITWTPDIKDWTKITDKSAQFILAQSENVLKETLETSKGISAKTDRLLSIYTPLMTLLSVYVFNLISTKEGLISISTFLPITAILSITIIGISLCYCLKNFFKHHVSILGEYPKNMLRSELIDEYVDNDQYLNLLINLCQNLQYRIDSNRRSNNRRIKYNDISLRIFIVGLPCCPILSSVYLYLSNHLHSFWPL